MWDALQSAPELDSARGEVFILCEQQSPTARLWAEQILDAADSSSELVCVPDERLPPDLAMTGATQPLLAPRPKPAACFGWIETDP